MAVAVLGAPRAVKLDKLVLNDVGPELGLGALGRIADYVGKNMMHGTVAEAAEHLLSIGKGFGPHSKSQWLELSRHMVRDDGRGGVALHYDPAIALPFKSVGAAAAQAGEAALWAMYDALACETLLVRGADSDLLSAETALRMAARGPKPRIVEFEGVGHAPTFVDERQREAVRSFLLG
jgi:pimeloyl-ACP methyl ester carboxylesterase